MALKLTEKERKLSPQQGPFAALFIGEEND